jgi:Uma2 family endonuclease
VAIAEHSAPVLTRRRFNVTEYYRMTEVGILREDDHVELIAGEIIQMSPIGASHGECTSALEELLGPQVRGQARLRGQTSMRLDDASEPQPDLALVRYRRYRQTLPTAADVFFLVEVADSSLDYDLGVKLPLYAAAGIGEVFVVDTIHDVVERHTEPRDGHYRCVLRAGRGESLTSTVLPAVTLPLDVVLGYELPE